MLFTITFLSSSTKLQNYKIQNSLDYLKQSKCWENTDHIQSLEASKQLLSMKSSFVVTLNTILIY